MVATGGPFLLYLLIFSSDLTDWKGAGKAPLSAQGRVSGCPSALLPLQPGRPAPHQSPGLQSLWPVQDTHHTQPITKVTLWRCLLL